MSIASEITRIKNNISDSYDYCAAKGATMPSISLRDSDHLANTINSIEELRGQEVTIYEYSPIGTEFYPTGTCNGITKATTVMKRCDLSITPSTSAQSFDIFSISQAGPPLPPEVINYEGLSGFGTVYISGVDSTIDANITSSNIKNGVTILGVTGDYVTPPNPKALNITPSVSSQYFSDYGGSSGYTGFGPVSVDAVTSSIDANIDPGNIKDGVTILGVTGDFTGTVINNDSLNVTPTTSQQIFTAYGSSQGYTGFDPVTVEAVDYTIDSNIQSSNIKDGVTILGVTGSVIEASLDSASVTPSTSSQLITPSGVYNGFYEINVDAVDDTIDSNIQSYNIKDGVSILGVTGSLIEVDGTTEYVTPTTSQQTIYPTSPYNCFTEIVVDAVDDSIDPNIISSNIKNGVTILGVTGSYSGTSPTLITKNITQNGTYNASSDSADGYSSVTVNVSSGPTAQTAMTYSGSQLTINKAWIKDLTTLSEPNDIVINLSNLQGQVQGQYVSFNCTDISQIVGQSGSYTFYLFYENNVTYFRFTQQQYLNNLNPLARVTLTTQGWYPPPEWTSADIFFPMNYWTTAQS